METNKTNTYIRRNQEGMKLYILPNHEKAIKIITFEKNWKEMAYSSIIRAYLFATKNLFRIPTDWANQNLSQI